MHARAAATALLTIALSIGNATVTARVLPEDRGIPGIFRMITFKVMLDESHAVVSCSFERSSSRFGPDPEYPHVTYKPNDAFVAAACAQISALPHLYVPRDSDGRIEPLYESCTLEELSNEASST